LCHRSRLILFRGFLCVCLFVCKLCLFELHTDGSVRPYIEILLIVPSVTFKSSDGNLAKSDGNFTLQMVLPAFLFRCVCLSVFVPFFFGSGTDVVRPSALRFHQIVTPLLAIKLMEISPSDVYTPPSVFCVLASVCLVSAFFWFCTDDGVRPSAH
jgi:hypothetical protein